MMLSECEAWAETYGITFSTDATPSKSKTKAMKVTGRKNTPVSAVPLFLNGKNLPYVSSVLHLGHTFDQTGAMEADTRSKRIIYIQKVCELREDSLVFIQERSYTLSDRIATPSMVPTCGVLMERKPIKSTDSITPLFVTCLNSPGIQESTLWSTYWMKASVSRHSYSPDTKSSTWDFTESNS